MSFANWLKNYRGDQMIMQLASDAEISPPHGMWGVEELRQHMLNNGAPNEALIAVDVAEQLWRRSRQRVAETPKPL